MSSTLDPLSKEIGERLRQTRHDRQLSLSELSLRTGGMLGKSRISNYEQGLRRMGLEPAHLLAKALDVSPSWLLGLTEKGNITPEEQRLLELYRRTDARGQHIILDIAHSVLQPEPDCRLKAA